MAINYRKNLDRIRSAGLAPVPRTGSISLVMDALGDLEIPWTHLATGEDAQDVYVRGGIANVIVAADALSNEHGIELRDAIARLTAGLPRAWLTSLRAMSDPDQVNAHKAKRTRRASRDRKSDQRVLPPVSALPMLPAHAGPDCLGAGV